jgi:hypothetical protein
MKPFIISLLAVFALGCTSPVPPVAISPVVSPPTAQTKPNRHIYNSAWQIVGQAYVATNAKDLTSDAALADQVAAYNAAHDDDQYFLVNGEEVPIADAPPANLFVVKATTYELCAEIDNVPRIDLVTNRESCRLQCQMYGDAIMFVDKVPPAPIPVIDTRTDYEKYAIYLVLNPDGIESADDILYETHTTADLYLPTLGSYNQQAQMTPGSYVVTGRIYPAVTK